MKNSSTAHLLLSSTIALLLAFIFISGWSSASVVSAQVPAVETTVTEQPTATPSATPTDTPVPTVTDTPTPTDTPVGPTNTPTQVVTLPPDTPTPVPPGPVPIPEPITVVLFGTGLAALSAAVASRRKREE